MYFYFFTEKQKETEGNIFTKIPLGPVVSKPYFVVWIGYSGCFLFLGGGGWGEGGILGEKRCCSWLVNFSSSSNFQSLNG